MNRAQEAVIPEQDERKEQANATLDLRGVTCPMTFVRVKLALEKMNPGQQLEVLLDSGEAMHNVPRAIKEDGHRVLKVNKLLDSFSLLIRRGVEG